VNEQKPGFHVGFPLVAIDFDVHCLLFCHFVAPDHSRLLLPSTLNSAR
jgi:hypothetical protein